MPTPFEHHLIQLLQQHECVVVPDFGGFVANYRPARLHPISKRFDPPGRAISFNRLLVHNDGLLAAYAAQRDGESYESALVRLKNYAQQLTKQLMQNGQCDLPGIGRVLVDEARIWRFEPADTLAFSPNSFGLKPFFAAPVLTVLPSTQSVEKIAESPAATVVAIQKHIPVARWAAAATTALFISYTAWLLLATPMVKQPGWMHASAYVPFIEPVVPSYNVSDRKTVSVPEFESTTRPAEGFETLRNEALPDKTAVVMLAPEAAETPLNYHIVVGCFSIAENAALMVENLRAQMHPATVVDQHKGLHRVAVASFATRAEAEARLVALSAHFSGAWLLHK